ncbi:MAG: hypothetical protein RLZZ618_3574 [Pseudomonadota bacterium]|jgi:hypothetical protein
MDKNQLQAEIPHAVAWEILYVEKTISALQAETRIKDIEARFLGIVGASDELVLEVKLTMLAWRFKILFSRHEDSLAAQRAYEEAVAFGFSSLDDEATVHMLYAIYCFDESLLDESEAVLKNLDRMVEDTVGLSPAWIEQTKGEIRRLRDRFPKLTGGSDDRGSNFR